LAAELQGIGYHWEMGMLGQGGLTPYQVLYACTLGPFSSSSFFLSSSSLFALIRLSFFG
jgi:hypothetical protein